MFRFFRRKKSAPEAPVAPPAPEQTVASSAPASAPALHEPVATPAVPAPKPEPAAASAPAVAKAAPTVPPHAPEPVPADADAAPPARNQTFATGLSVEPAPALRAARGQAAARAPEPAAPQADEVLAAAPTPTATPTAPASLAAANTAEAAEPKPEPAPASAAANVPVAADAESAGGASAAPEQIDTPRVGWLARLKGGLAKTGHSITTVFTGTQIDDALYEDLETALLLADTGVSATEFLLQDLKRRVKQAHARNPQEVRELLRVAVTALLAPLEKTLVVGVYHPTVIMIAGVNGAGKTTSIGKLTKHMADAGASVLLAAADTFRAAAREQLEIWADRNQVEIISQAGADPAAVSFDAVAAGRARDKDVVLVDTAGRLPTQKHLMEELAKIHRVITKADLTAPHEVLLVIDGNTGQNALAQVKAFDDVIKLTGLIVTKLDGTAKGGVLCAIAREHPIPVYFIGIGEALEDLQTFRAAEFARALTD